MIHKEPHNDAGATVLLPSDLADQLGGNEFHVEDWWDRVGKGSWMFEEGNPACLQYAMRTALTAVPLDNEVIYGHVGGIGHLIHVSEIHTQ